MSGIALQHYATTDTANSGGIYGSSNNFSLNTNTIILFVLVLGVAFLLSVIYLALARLFPKVFIWVSVSPPPVANEHFN